MADKHFWVGPPNTMGLRAVDADISHVLERWLNSVHERIGSNPFQIPTYTVGTLPDASVWSDNNFTSLVGVSDETGGYTVAFSDGTNWRRVQDYTIVS